MQLDLNEILDALADKIMERMVKQPAPAIAPSAPAPTVVQQTWFTTKQAAMHLGVSYQLLEGLRTHGGGPEYSKTRNLVRYQREDLDAWMAGRKRRNTSEKPRTAKR